ncbi:hypothetical protein H4R34_006001, partial [Dimargaris verticillata]
MAQNRKRGAAKKPSSSPKKMATSRGVPFDSIPNLAAMDKPFKDPQYKGTRKY